MHKVAPGGCTHTGKNTWRYSDKVNIVKLRREASEEAQYADTLVLDFEPPEVRDNKVLLLKATQCVIVCHGSLDTLT